MKIKVCELKSSTNFICHRGFRVKWEMGDGVPHDISIKRLGWKSFYGGFNKLSNKTGEL